VLVVPHPHDGTTRPADGLEAELSSIARSVRTSLPARAAPDRERLRTAA
jgi:hypothetical protein